MKLKTFLALLGAVISVALVGGVYAFLQLSWITFVVVGGLAIVGYVVAAIAANPLTKTTAFGEIMRGFLIGLNAAANFIITFAIVQTFAGAVGGIIVGATLGALNILSVIGPLSRGEFFQGIVGYLNWFMPMSWPIVAVGLLFTLISYLLHGITFGKVAYLKVQAMRMDWKTGTLFIKGGLIANLNYADTAFNMGNFSFVDYKSPSWYTDHEAGHTLNLSAFGFLFHLIGALDENATPRGERAFAERLAESNCPGTGRPVIPMWA
ncbi:MAG: hypothetical protein K0U72_01585 [Gammaproteobacteria bacterium]|nr:hypothetical protein [Gammaproteobacteria bacterium]